MSGRGRPAKREPPHANVQPPLQTWVSSMFRYQAWLSLAFITLAGCQTYQRRPLDFARHRAGWEARDVASAPVSEYAQRLSALGHPQGGKFDTSDGLTLPEAEVVALFFNPQLRIARLRARVPLLGAREAGRWE